MLSIGSCGEKASAIRRRQNRTCDPGPFGRRRNAESALNRRSPHRPPASTTGPEARIAGRGAALRQDGLSGKECALSGVLRAHRIGGLYHGIHPNRLRTLQDSGEFTGFDEVAIWKQILLHIGGFE